MKRYLNAFFELLLCLFLGGVIFITDTTASGNGETGTISGSVVGVSSSDPGSGAVIYVFEYSSLSGQGWNLLGWTTTDNEGHYTTPGLPEGQYGVRFHATGYATGWYQDAYTADDATPVSVTAPYDTPNIDFSLEPGQAGSPLTTPMAGFVIDDARIHFRKKAGDDVVRNGGRT